MYQPTIMDLGKALVPWFALMFSSSVIRAETKYWVNMSILAVVYPLMIRYLSDNNLLLSMSKGSVLIAVSVSILTLITLTEGVKWQQLKKNFKEFGKDPKQTALTTLVVMLSLVFGLAVAYYSQGKSIIHI